MKNEISEKLIEDQNKNNENIANLQNDFKNLKQEISERIDNIETKQKQQMENVKNLLEAGTSGKSRNLIKKIITDNPDELTKVKNAYIKPTKLEIHALKKQIMDDEKAPNDKIKKKRQMKKKHTMEKELELENYILRKKELNEFIHNDNIMHQTLAKKSANTNNLFERIKLDKMNKERQAADGMKKYLQKSLKLPRLSMKGKFRSVVYTFMCTRKFKQLLRESQLAIKIASLTSFLKTREEFDNKLMNLVFMSIKNVYMDILTNLNLLLDLSDGEGGFHKKQQNEEKYIKLEARIQNIFELLSDNTTNKFIEEGLVNYLQVLTHEGSCVPTNFFSYFEMSRVSFEDNCFKNISPNQQKMILCVHLLVRIMVKNILIDNKVKTQNDTNLSNKIVKGNLKMLATVIYRAVIDNYAKSCPQDPISKKKFIFKGFQISTPKRVSTPKSERIDNHEKFDDKYINAYKTWVEKKNSTKDESEVAYQNANKQLDKKVSDSSDNEIEYIEKLLYKKTELTSFNHLAQSHSLNLSKIVTDWVDKLYYIVYAKTK